MLTITYPDGEIECVQMSAMPESATSGLVFQQSARTNLGGDPVADSFSIADRHHWKSLVREQ